MLFRSAICKDLYALDELSELGDLRLGAGAVAEPVGMHQQMGDAFEMNLMLRELMILAHSERRTIRADLRDLDAIGHEQGSMTGATGAEREAVRAEIGELRGDEHVRAVQLGEKAEAELAHELRRLGGEVEMRVEIAAESGGEERGGHAFAHHIGDDEKASAISELDAIEEVTTHFADRGEMTCTLHGGALWQLQGEQRALDVRGDLQLTFDKA